MQIVKYVIIATAILFAMALAYGMAAVLIRKSHYDAVMKGRARVADEMAKYCKNTEYPEIGKIVDEFEGREYILRVYDSNGIYTFSAKKK